jgi:hypothetical protein
MIIALGDEPLFHPVVWAHRDIIQQVFPHLDDGLIRELLKDQNLILKDIGFTQ